MKPKIAIIEDEIDIIRLLRYNLEKEGYEVVSYESGENATDFIRHHQPDLVLLDIMIPVIDGFEVCKQLKRNPNTQTIPILMVSAKTEESNIVTGLELGADDYITKPFSIAVLIARIRATLRRRIETVPLSETVWTFDTLKIYPDRYEIYVDTHPVFLSHTEFNLLCCLAQRPGRVFSRLQIIDFMKGENYFVTPRLVDVLLVSIRKKLGVGAELIQTVRGVGYKFKTSL